MPEREKHSESNEASSVMNEPADGLKDMGAEAAQQPKPSSQMPHDEADVLASEGAGGKLPEGLDDENLAAFADSVVSGLQQASLDIETPGEAERPIDPDGTPASEAAGDFFAGWDGPGEELEELPPLDEYALSQQHTLSEIGIASATLSSEHADRIVSKHDELADAVQSALYSIYGDPSSPSFGSASENGVISHPASASDARWNGGPEVFPPQDQLLSPQEVILNYFDYNPTRSQRSGASNGTATHGRSSLDRYEQTVAAHEYYETQQPRWQGQNRGSYDGPPSYPVPVAPGQAARADLRAERESGRLLGAAAVGLVGGIAIAATLAVFVINSYGPDARILSGPANRWFDSQDVGYGRSSDDVKESRAAKVASRGPSSEASGEIFADDIVATAGQPAALAISVKSDFSPEQALVSINGIPEGTRLSAGIDAGGGSWLLSPRRLNGLTINVPEGAPRTVPLEVQLLDGNARTPLSEKRQFVVRVNSVKPNSRAYAAVVQGTVQGQTGAQAPQVEQSAGAVPTFNTQTVPGRPSGQAESSSSPPGDAGFKTQTVAAPPQQPAPAFQASLAPEPAKLPGNAQDAVQKSASKAEVEDLIREGNKRMREGDILLARQLYQKAIASGDPEAALAMGRSYDPIYFARIDKKNAEPDAAKAFDWYRKAMDAGAVQTAKVRIENLRHFLNE